MTKQVFVIMPFTKADDRSEDELTAMFLHNIKGPIESAQLQHNYQVTRSDKGFAIKERIVESLCRADVVIADLSCTHETLPNANVTYELGIRLAISHNPVILIASDGSTRAFDVNSYTTHYYNPRNLHPLQELLISELRKCEESPTYFFNPIKEQIAKAVGTAEPKLASLSPDRQRQAILSGFRVASGAVLDALGPNAKGLGTGRQAGFITVRSGTEIVARLDSPNPYEAHGIAQMRHLAATMENKVGDGTKLAIIIAY